MLGLQTLIPAALRPQRGPEVTCLLITHQLLETV